MATRPTAKIDDSAQKQTSELRYVARQPILDLHSRAHGYELLFWNGRKPFVRADSDLATRTMLDNSVVFGLEELARGLPAFVNCTAESLTEEWVKVLPPDMTVLELSSSAERRASGSRWPISPAGWSPAPWPIWPTTSRWI